MFTCSICDDTIGGIHHNSTYTTQCGHVFHHQCLMTWLERSPTCPFCRSSVLENSVVKLFLQADENARVTWDRRTDEEIKTLNEQLKSLKEKETSNSSSIKHLEAQLKNKDMTLDKNRRSLNYFKKKAENQKKKHSEVSGDLKFLTEKYNALETERQTFQYENLSLQTSNKSLNYELYDLQSSNSSYIDKLKMEIADLQSKITCFQSQCYNKKSINIEQPSTSKMNIGNNNALPLQFKTKYNGPDFQLHTFNEQFLLGCVFLFVEDLIEHEHFNVSMNTIIFKEDISKYGGSVEQNYSVRVTHVICVTQKDHLVEQCIKDGKRCVTYYWLIDIFAKKTMIAPWLAIHFPLPYSKENMPCQNLQFAIVNFDINEHQIIKSMIEQVGGCVTDITCKTDIVISQNSKGELVEKALAIHKPVVNVQWLNDILFGEKIGIKEHGLLKYKQFDLNNPFLVNSDMVSRLMEAWKTPLILCESQQMSDLIINSASLAKCKRQKTMSTETQETINLNGDDIDDDDVIITCVKKFPLKPFVLLSGFSFDDTEILKMVIKTFGCTLARNYSETTHLIMKKPIPSIDFYGCLSTVKYILNEHWLRHSHSYLKLQDEKKYIIQNVQHEYFGLCNITTILQNNMRHVLFKNVSFFVTPGIEFPPCLIMKLIIMSAGGTVEKKRRSLESIRGSAPNSYFIISCQGDRYFYKDLFGISNVVYSPKFITCSILTQQVLLQKFLLEITTQD